jgi:hypothetical protein
VDNSSPNFTDPSGRETAVFERSASDSTRKIFVVVLRKDNKDGDLYGILIRDGKRQFFGHCIHDPAANPPIIIRKDQWDDRSEILGGVWYNIGFATLADRNDFSRDWAEIMEKGAKNKVTGEQLVKDLEALIKKYENAGKLNSKVKNCPAIQKYTVDRDPKKDGSTWPKDNDGKDLEKFPDGYLTPTVVPPK